MTRLEYMLLCKIMTGKQDAEEVPAIVASKAGLKYAGAAMQGLCSGLHRHIVVGLCRPRMVPVT